MNDYTALKVISQPIPRGNILIPSHLPGFTNTSTERIIDNSQHETIRINGVLEEEPNTRICPVCQSKLHLNNIKNLTQDIQHIPFGSSHTIVRITRRQLYCPCCRHTQMQRIPFKANEHRISKALETYVCDLLGKGNYTLLEIASLTGLCKNIVKQIDKKRLMDLYTTDINDKKRLKRPKRQAKYLGIDEFKLHKNHKYATHITDLETGHILWIGYGKRKKVVYDFIKHVGNKWMKGVKAVACDMNSDFQEAFQEKCPYIHIVYDYFHIIKNFNDKVVSSVRIDEYKRLMAEGDMEAAKSLKKSKYILTSSRRLLKEKDNEAKAGTTVRKGSTIFGTKDIVRKGEFEARYDEIIQQNELLFTCDLIKEKLDYAFHSSFDFEMKFEIYEIIDLCYATENIHFKWFARLLENHLDGIINHANYNISTGKLEGINNKIKTLRRNGYGYPDDEYFFLKIIDASRN